MAGLVSGDQVEHGTNDLVEFAERDGADSTTGHFFGGVVRQAGRAAGGMMTAARHPLDAAAGAGRDTVLGHAATSVYGLTQGESARDALHHGFVDDHDPIAQAVHDRRYAEAAGRATFDIGGAVFGARAAGAVGDAAAGEAAAGEGSARGGRQYGETPAPPNGMRAAGLGGVDHIDRNAPRLHRSAANGGVVSDLDEIAVQCEAGGQAEAGQRIAQGHGHATPAEMHAALSASRRAAHRNPRYVSQIGQNLANLRPKDLARALEDYGFKSMAHPNARSLARRVPRLQVCYSSRA